jgi:type II secretory pathway pseudopilin PulG
MGPVAIIAGIGLAIGAGSAYMSYKAQKKQTKLQKKAVAAQRAQDNLRAARERSEAIRNARISSWTVEQNAANQGASDTSAALGGLGSISSQLNSGLSFLDTYNKLSDQATESIGKANVQAMKAQTWNSVGQLGMQVFQNASGIGGVFGANKGA